MVPVVHIGWSNNWIRNWSSLLSLITGGQQLAWEYTWRLPQLKRWGLEWHACSHVYPIRRNFVGKIYFLWVPLPTKIKPTKFCTQWKLFTLYTVLIHVKMALLETNQRSSTPKRLALFSTTTISYRKSDSSLLASGTANKHVPLSLASVQWLYSSFQQPLHICRECFVAPLDNQAPIASSHMSW